VLFLEILDQLNEFDGDVEDDGSVNAESVGTDEVKKTNHKKTVKKEPSISVQI